MLIQIDKEQDCSFGSSVACPQNIFSLEYALWLVEHFLKGVAYFAITISLWLIFTVIYNENALVD